MTPNEINEAIAKSLGIKTIIKTRKNSSGESVEVVATQVPSDEIGFSKFRQLNYYGSLDACAEFEASLSAIELDKYQQSFAATQIEYDRDEYHEKLIRLTAPQRCEAYLRTKLLWKE